MRTCPICDGPTTMGCDCVGYIMIKVHTTCDGGCWGEDWVTGSRKEWFVVDENTSIDYITDKGGVLIMKIDNMFEEVKDLTFNQVQGYQYIARSLMKAKLAKEQA